MEPEATDTLRERKKRSTRRALRLAALRLVAERGLDGVTTDEIAAAADVSPRTFFNYFAGKEDALVGNDPELAGTLVAALAARPAAEPPLAALRAVLVEYAAAATIDPTVWPLRLQVLEANPHLRAALAGASAELDRALTVALAERIGAAPADLYPAVVVAAATSAVRTALWHAGATRFARPLATTLDEAFDHLAAGLAEPTRAGSGRTATDA
ncbi:TetR/AcrR family transcriptional regulator [Actinotalea solisilvae]|uniref:TetR/AcrR family transcriptional regulator n=1 Tax=Actinotalea solisilvae TaxID=2072922 RepID=UPI0018F1CA91|nr:TetR family transcriptional regulator [Actinotalea solisilvae]